MENEAWKTIFEVVAKSQGHFLVVKKGDGWSYNMIFYKTKGGATRGAIAAYKKLHRDFENAILK